MSQLKRALLTVSALTILMFYCGLSLAHEHKQEEDNVAVENAWARATFALAKTGAVYLSIDNQSGHKLKLLSVSVDSTVASDAQLHETLMEEEVMQMREVTNGFEIASGSTLEFLPGGKHVMLMGLEKPLITGEQFVLSLTFENRKVMRVPIEVKDAR